MNILQIALQKMIIFKFMLTCQITVLYTEMTTLVGYNFTKWFKNWRVNLFQYSLKTLTECITPDTPQGGIQYVK